jgi:hypothetical protein
VAEAKILLVSIPSLIENSQKKIVFNETFLSHFNIMEIAKMGESSR